MRLDSPVFLTKNGHGKYDILQMGNYDRLTAEGKLFAELNADHLSNCISFIYVSGRSRNKRYSVKHKMRTIFHKLEKI